MPSQQVEIAETIAALRRARDRDKKAPSNQPIYSATNRGNKLYRGADHVHAGVLAYSYGPETYKQKIEHGGYTRYILERNPRRYDGYGNELEDSETDEEADADAADENAYDGILIEELLGPLKNPGELATHPALSLPYLDRALVDMVKSTEEKLRHEKANLWRAKNLNGQFIGDVSWIPCEAVESPGDWDIFEPRKTVEEQVNKKRKREIEIEAANDSADAQHSLPLPDGPIENMETETPSGVENLQKGPELAGNGRSLKDADLPETNSVEDLNAATAEDIKTNGGDEPAVANGTLSNHGTDEVGDQKVNGEVEVKDEAPSAQTRTIDGEDVEQTSEATSPPPPSRRITRALAATNNSVSHSNAPTPPLSPTPTLTASSTSSLYQVDPLFLLPSHLSSTGSTRAAFTSAYLYGLPAEEATETRKLLTMYIQKQEESVRGYEAVLMKLVRARRMRDEVMEICKAEGHVGEMSDGEDWIDYQRWGLTPGELRKGRDEEDEGGDGEREVAGIGGRKGKRRRN